MAKEEDLRVLVTEANQAIGGATQAMIQAAGSMAGLKAMMDAAQSGTVGAFASLQGRVQDLVPSIEASTGAFTESVDAVIAKFGTVIESSTESVKAFVTQSHEALQGSNQEIKAALHQAAEDFTSHLASQKQQITEVLEQHKVAVSEFVTKTAGDTREEYLRLAADSIAPIKSALEVFLSDFNRAFADASRVLQAAAIQAKNDIKVQSVTIGEVVDGVLARSLASAGYGAGRAPIAMEGFFPDMGVVSVQPSQSNSLTLDEFKNEFTRGLGQQLVDFKIAIGELYAQAQAQAPAMKVEPAKFTVGKYLTVKNIAVAWTVTTALGGFAYKNLSEEYGEKVICFTKNLVTAMPALVLYGLPGVVTFPIVITGIAVYSFATPYITELSSSYKKTTDKMVDIGSQGATNYFDFIFSVPEYLGYDNSLSIAGKDGAANKVAEPTVKPAGVSNKGRTVKPANKVAEDSITSNKVVESTADPIASNKVEEHAVKAAGVGGLEEHGHDGL